MSPILDQIRNEYTESNDYFLARKQRQVKQLQLLNNLQRGDENIASSLLFSFFNRVLSNLYDDKIQIKFVPSEEMDYKKIEALNKLAINDFREMDMPRIQYDSVWDSCFFGRGFIETAKFNKERKLLEPKVLNPLACGTDPFFSEPSQWRYYWKWVLKPGWEIKNLIDAGVITGIKSLREIPSGLEENLWNFKVQRDQAKKLTSTGQDSVMVFPDEVEGIYQILEIYTTDQNGNRIVSWVDKGFSHILMTEKLKLEKDESWPVVVKEIFREPHSAVSFSVPDLIEDKHRAESVLLNLAYVAAKDEANPVYAYNPDLVKDVTQLFQRQINQHIPVEDTQLAIAPLNKNAALSTSLLAFLNILRNEAQDPIGSGMTFQPTKKGKETATKAALDQQTVDMSQSLQSKILQIGEKEFWGHWYRRYLQNTKDGDKKILALTSVKGVTFESINLGDIRTKYPPKVMVLSAKEAEFKELVNKRDMMQIFPQFAQTMTPEGFKNFNKHIFLPKFVEDSSLIDLVLPKSIDELNAEKENDMLNQDKSVEVKETDDHETHLYIHEMAKNTPAKIVHCYWHQELLALQKKREQEMAMMQGQMQPPQMAKQLDVGQNNPLEATAAEKESKNKKVALV